MLKRMAWIVTAVVIAQSAMFAAAVWVNRGGYLYSDNRFYETPAWNLATGHGYSIARTEWEDPYLTALYAARHPGESLEFIPAVVFPPGYGFYLAGVYAVTGRSHVAAVLANGPLLLMTLACLMILAWRAFDDRPRRIVFLALCAVFPFWAFWAARIVSDPLHAALIAAAFVVWTDPRGGRARLVATGVLFGVAALTRPYSLLLPLALAAWWAIRRQGRPAVAGALLVTLVSWVIMGAWVVRNDRAFGVPMVTSITKGYGVWQATYEAENGKFRNLDERVIHAGILAAGAVDIYRHDDNRRFLTLGLERIAAAPGTYALGALASVPRIWMPIGNDFGTPVRIVLGTWYGLLFVAMLAGLAAAAKARNAVLDAAFVTVVYYTAIFMLSHFEGRYVLAARGFAFLLIAAGPVSSIIWTSKSAAPPKIHPREPSPSSPSSAASPPARLP